MGVCLGPIMNILLYIFGRIFGYEIFWVNKEDFSLLYELWVSNDVNREYEPEEDLLRSTFPEKIVIVEQQSHICREEQSMASEGWVFKPTRKHSPVNVQIKGYKTPQRRAST